MRRTSLLLFAGVTLGVVASYLVQRDRSGPAVTGAAVIPLGAPDRSAAPTPAGAADAVELLQLATGSTDVAERAAIYRWAAAAERRDLASLIPQLAVLPTMEARNFALEVLLTRYAEIEPRAAVALATELTLPLALRAPIYRSWATRDPAGALRALGDLDAPTAAAMGVEVLKSLGNDDLGIARVLGAAPQIDSDRLRVEAAVAKAATDPRAALEDALLLPPNRGIAATARIATIWAKSDVHGALSQVALIDDEVRRNAFRGAVLREWANTAPEDTIKYLLELDPAEQRQALEFGGLDAVGQIDPAAALTLAEGLPGEFGRRLRQLSLIGLAKSDPLAALRQAEALAPGAERDQAFNLVATGYALEDPEAALAWAQTLQPPSPAILATVLDGLARRDPSRAIELLFSLTSPSEQQMAFQRLAMNGSLTAEHTTAVADRLLATPGRRSNLQTFVNLWAQRAPEDALPWLLANPGSTTANALARAGVRLAMTNPAAAIGYLERVPSDQRPTWLNSVAQGYAQTDPRAAADWVAQYRGQPGYDAAVATVAARTASYDPLAAVRLYESIDASQAPDAPQAAMQIATSWARQDPRAAASWVLGLANEEMRTAAVGVVAGQWAQHDGAAARAWALNLPAGAPRDAALVPIFGAVSGAGGVDRALLGAFSTDEARQRGVSQVLPVIAQQDAVVAQQLVDEVLTDPALRRQASRVIEQSLNGPFGPRAVPFVR